MSDLRKLCATLLFALISLLPGHAAAVINAIDAVPGATVLYPYFEVDLANPAGETTVMSLNNSSATAILGKVTVWSDRGVPVLSFPVYLTGYDVASWNMRDILNGSLPVSASAGQDQSPYDAISHKGPLSQDINFASCTGTLPLSTLGAGVVSDLRAALTGQAVSGALTGIPAGNCVATSKGDQVARGYVTVDAVNNCTPRTPAETGYLMTSGTGDATLQNTLWGDYLQVNLANNTAYGDLATMIEAQGLGYVPGDYTFYGRFVGWTAADSREALASHWMVHGEVDTSQLVVWRDSKSTADLAGFSCSGLIASPGNLYVDAAWFDSFATNQSVPYAFPNSVDKVTIGQGGALSEAPTKKLGFLALGLEHGNTVGLSDPTQAQALVSVVRKPKGGGNRYLTGAMAFPVNQVLTPNAMGFRSLTNY